MCSKFSVNNLPLPIFSAASRRSQSFSHPHLLPSCTTDSHALVHLRESAYTKDPIEFYRKIREHMLAHAVRAHPPPLPLYELAPWISPSVRGQEVFDSERDKGGEKAYRPHPEVPEQHRATVEQFIRTGGIDQVPLMKASQLRETLAKFGISSGTSRLTKAQMQERIYAAIESDYGTCSKLFVKPPGTSGGVIFMLCPHGFIYGFKVLLRSESVTVCLLPVPYSLITLCSQRCRIRAGRGRYDTLTQAKEPSCVRVRLRLRGGQVSRQTAPTFDLQYHKRLSHPPTTTTQRDACPGRLLRSPS